MMSDKEMDDLYKDKEEKGIDTFNKFLVAANSNGIVFLKPIPQNITNDDALLLAAYLVCMAENGASEDFEKVLKAVEST